LVYDMIQEHKVSSFFEFALIEIRKTDTSSSHRMTLYTFRDMLFESHDYECQLSHATGMSMKIKGRGYTTCVPLYCVS
jgi:hypothetical protein